MKLDAIRAKLNKIDTKIVELIAKRQSYMPAVGKYKKEHGLALNQPAREKEILDAKRKLAAELKVDTVLVEKIFKLLFKNGKDIQRKS